MKKLKDLKIGLALGGGGVRGFAHIPVLQALDELGIRPSVIAGCSIGALVGALYACGMTGWEIRDLVKSHFLLSGDKWRDVMEKKAELMKWFRAFSFNLSGGPPINPQGALKYLLNQIKKTKFEDLEIPLIVNATDFWTSEEVVIEKGELLPAIQASMAVPGIFSPVSIAKRVLVDGGIVNVVPYEHLIGRADLVIAVDVNKDRSSGSQVVPNVVESILGAFDVMMAATLAEKMKYRKPDLYVHPENGGIRILDFSKVQEVLERAEPAADAFKKDLIGHLA